MITKKLDSKRIVLFLLIITLTFLLVLISGWSGETVILNGYSRYINKQIIYQSTTFFIALIFLLILWFTLNTEFKEYFRKGNISARITPEPKIGIKPKRNENWLHIGSNLTIIITIVTAIIIYFQTIKVNDIAFINLVNVLPYSFLFALSNSFVEEIITRFGIVVVLKDKLNDKQIPFVSATVFGTVHYWGNPGGPVGVLVAGFLGWFLTKSIIETKGIFWAWLIHFLQDVIIITALLAK